MFILIILRFPPISVNANLESSELIDIKTGKGLINILFGAILMCGMI